jgi:multidrug efflux system membrane fusion protein
MLPRPALTFVLLLLLVAGCSGNDRDKDARGGADRRAATAVTTALCRTQDIPVVITATGRVEASASVAIRAQVGGILHTIHFREGREVRQGELLFTIDSRPYQAQLKAKEALLAKDQAELDNAAKELERYRPAAGKGFVSQVQADQAATRVASLKAAVLADRAAVDSARLDLQYCTLTAPFAGLAGEIQADAGNLVKAGDDTPLVIINRIAPVSVAFDIAGERLPEVQQAMGQGGLAVEVALAGSNQAVATGDLTFIDNSIDPATGLIRFKADFANTDRLLWPGRMVAVSLQLGHRRSVPVVPSQAVQIGQDGAHVFVARDDHTVAYRQVVTGVRHGGETEIVQGLAAGERVVTDGHLQLVDGGRIEDRSDRPAGVGNGTGNEGHRGAGANGEDGGQ